MSKILKLLAKGKARASSTSLLNILHYQLMQNRNVVFYNFDKHDWIKKGYRSNAEVYKIVRKIVDKCAVPPTYLYHDNGKADKYFRYRKGKTATDAVKGKIWRAKALDFIEGENDLLNLIERPNSYQSWKEMMELFRIFYFVQGEAFLWRETAIDSDIALSVHVAPSNLIEPIYSDDEENIIKGWRIDLLGGLERELEAKDVMHLKMANPEYTNDGVQLRGQSPLLAGLKYLQLDDKAIEAWLKSVENEGAKGIVSPNHADPELWLTPEQVRQTEEEVRKKIHGTENRNKIAVSGMPLQYTQIGFSPDALNLIEALNTAQINLADLWGVPAVLFDPNPTYQNQKAAAERFVSEVIIPYLEKEEEKLNSWLVKPFSERDGKDYYLDNDTSQFEELKISLDERQSLAKILTINEMRIIEGYDTIDEKVADEVFIPQGQIPLSEWGAGFNFNDEL